MGDDKKSGVVVDLPPGLVGPEDGRSGAVVDVPPGIVKPPNPRFIRCLGLGALAWREWYKWEVGPYYYCREFGQVLVNQRRRAHGLRSWCGGDGSVECVC